MKIKNKQAEKTSELWERQPDEGPQAFKAFAAYRDSGTGGKRRSLTKTAQNLTKRDGTPYSAGTLKTWSQRHNWQERVDAYDQYLDRQIQDELRRSRMTMLKNHVGIAHTMMGKALRALQDIPAEELTVQDIARYVDIATRLERASIEGIDADNMDKIENILVSIKNTAESAGGNKKND